jgi:DNA-binding NtrC family response regulator
MNFNKLFRAAAAPIYVVGPRRKLLYVSPAAAAFLGASADQLEGLECRWHGADASADPASLVAGLCPPPEAFAGQPQRTHALLFSAGGERAWRSIQFLPVPHPKGAIAAVIGWIGEPDPAPPETPEPLRQALARHRRKLLEEHGLDRLVAAGDVMQRVLQQVRLAAGTKTAVWLEGEAGTGKETLARAIHYAGPGRERPFVALDCASLPPEVLHEQLAASGILNRGTGGFRPAAAAVYLEEAPAMPAHLQALLLEALRAKGEADPRVFAGSRRDPRQEPVLATPLYCALSTLSIALPPLRERRDDIPLLAQQIIEGLNENGEKQVAELTPATLDALAGYSWPGNISQLKAVLEEAHARCTGETLERGDLPWSLRVAVETSEPAPLSLKPLPLDKLLEDVERRLLDLALKQARGNKSKAAARLGISRARIHRRLVELGIVDEPEAAIIEELGEEKPEPEGQP